MKLSASLTRIRSVVNNRLGNDLHLGNEAFIY